MKRALQIVLGISLFGVAFSGTLTYRELFGASLEQCPAPGPTGTIFGYPACVYGFIMYMLMAGISFWGLRSGRSTHAHSHGDGSSPLRRNLTPDELP